LNGKTVINMSTVPADCPERRAKELAGHGITLIDAPVSGSKSPAEQGPLVMPRTGHP